MEYIVASCARCGGFCCKALVNHNTSNLGWDQISPAQAVELNPWLPADLDLKKFNWSSCNFLDKRGLCGIYDSRPQACRNFPNTELFFEEYCLGEAFFYTPFCYYRAETLVLQGLTFEMLPSGDECIEAYLRDIFLNAELVTQFHGHRYLIDQAYRVIGPKFNSRECHGN